MRFCLLLSILLHISLWWLLKKPPLSAWTKPQPLQIEIVPTPSSKKSTRRQGGKGGRGLGLRQFTSRGDELFRHKTPAEFDKIYAEAKGSSEWRPEDWGAKGGDFSQVEFLGNFDRLYREIEGLLNYPGVLALRDIQGTINARLTFDEKSRCQWKRTRVQGASSYLRVYITTLLAKLCSLENLQHLKFKKDQTVDLSFQFAIVEVNYPRPERSGISGNSLLFYRSHMKSSLEYQIGPIRGVWFVPAIALDPVWLIENWETYVEGKDPLRDFRSP